MPSAASHLAALPFDCEVLEEHVGHARGDLFQLGLSLVQLGINILFLVVRAGLYDLYVNKQHVVMCMQVTSNVKTDLDLLLFPVNVVLV